MRTGALFLAIVVAVTAAAPSVALAKKKHHPAPAPAYVDPNADGRNFLAEAMHQVFVPSESMGIVPATPAHKMKPHK